MDGLTPLSKNGRQDLKPEKASSGVPPVVLVRGLCRVGSRLTEASSGRFSADRAIPAGSGEKRAP